MRKGKDQSSQLAFKPLFSDNDMRFMWQASLYRRRFSYLIPLNNNTSFLSPFFHAGKFDYYENQGKLHDLYDVATSDKYVISSSVNSWYEEYINWARKQKPGQYFDQSSSKCA